MRAGSYLYLMTSKILRRQTASALTKRCRTIAAYSRRHPSTGWMDADSDQLKLTAVAAAAA